MRISGRSSRIMLSWMALFLKPRDSCCGICRKFLNAICIAKNFEKKIIDKIWILTLGNVQFIDNEVKRLNFHLAKEVLATNIVFKGYDQWNQQTIDLSNQFYL
ncbi:hypothetical protein ACJX0J_007928, partial [Zea mays]